MNINSIQGIKNASVSDIFAAGKKGELDYASIFRSKKEEIEGKIERGELEEKIQIGASAFSAKEWDRLMDNIDRVQQLVRERIDKETEEIRDGEKTKKAEKFFIGK